jgi:hypothetical protein
MIETLHYLSSEVCDVVECCVCLFICFETVCVIFLLQLCCTYAVVAQQGILISRCDFELNAARGWAAELRPTITVDA